MIILQYGNFTVATSHDDVKNAHDYVRYTINDAKIWVSATRSSYLPSAVYTSMLLNTHIEKLKAMDIRIIELTTEIASLSTKSTKEGKPNE